MPFDFDRDVLAPITEDAAAREANAGDPIAELFTWENHPAASIPLPGEVSTPTPPAPAASTSQKHQVKVGSDYRGMTDGGIERAGRVMSPADARAESRMAEERQFTQDQLGRTQEHYADVQKTFDDAILATRQYQEREAELRQQEQGFNSHAAELEQRLAGEAQADRAQYISAYKEQLAVVRQLALQSGNPMQGLSQGEALGLAGAQFAQGFLAAQGINIDVSGQVDRWVERSIREHQSKISNARDAAQDQLHLYEIARQNSEDEWEARQRYRGFVIAGLQSAIGLNASRFQSDIAMARANEQIARLQVESDATERAIADKYFERRKETYGQEFTRAYQMGNLAIERKKADIAMLEAQARKAMAEAEAKKKALDTEPADFVVSDIEYARDATGKELVDANGNKVMQNRWRVNGNVMKDPVLARQVWNDAAEARQAFADYDDATAEMIRTYAEAKKFRDKGGPFGTLKNMSWDVLARATDDPAVQAFVQARNSWAMKKIYAVSGKAATDVERKAVLEQAYADKFLAANGSKAEVSHAMLRKEGIKTFTRKMESLGMEEIPEGDPNRLRKSVGAAPRTDAVVDATITNEKPEPGLSAVLEGKATAKDSNDVVTTHPSGTWADFQREVQIPRGDKIKLGQPEYATHIDKLVAAYARPHYFVKNSAQFGVKQEKDETPAEIRREAYQALDRLARGAGDVPAVVSEYAMYLRDKLDADEVLAPLKDQEVDPKFQYSGVDDIEDSPLIKAMQPRK